VPAIVSPRTGQPPPRVSHLSTAPDQTSALDPSLTDWFVREVQPHEPKLRAWLQARFPSLTDVDDLVQESYARLLRAQRTGRVGNAKTYLFATARHAALDLFRRSQIVSIGPVEGIDELSVLEEGPGIVESLSRAQELEFLSEAMQTLPDRCRHVIVLQKIHGLSYKEIAARLGISESTVNAQLAKGVLRLRDFMRARRHESRVKP
jgi:RNA polymerase sigma-70 factor (ECF subfamily)